jgi:hypothetical protein
MNWDALGAIGELLGAAAVVLTLGYLAIQIRHSNNQTAANMGARILDEYKRMQEVGISNPYLADLLVKLKAGEQLTPSEDIQLDFYSDRYLTHWLQVQSGYDRGFVDDNLYIVMCDDVKRMLKTYPGIRGRLLEILDQYEVARSLKIMQPIFAEPIQEQQQANAT